MVCLVSFVFALFPFKVLPHACLSSHLQMLFLLHHFQLLQGAKSGGLGGPSASPNQAEPAFLFCFQFFFSCHLTLNRCRGPGQGARRTINLEARAAPQNQAEPAPISTSRSDGSTDSDAAQQAELDESPHVPTGVTNGDDIFQSAEDELEPNNVRAKTNAQVGLCQRWKVE